MQPTCLIVAANERMQPPHPAHVAARGDEAPVPGCVGPSPVHDAWHYLDVLTVAARKLDAAGLPNRAARTRVQIRHLRRELMRAAIAAAAEMDGGRA